MNPFVTYLKALDLHEVDREDHIYEVIEQTFFIKYKVSNYDDLTIKLINKRISLDNIEGQCFMRLHAHKMQQKINSLQLLP